MTTMDGKISDCVESKEEEFSESFVCCVCLDLLYKPVVLACGHVSCFWCVHKSMNGIRESNCPICRHPYCYFPTICQMLHFLLLKMYPVVYKRRENQVLEEEKQMSCFSPQFGVDSGDVGRTSSSACSSPVQPSSSKLESNAMMNQSGSSCPLQDNVRNGSEKSDMLQGSSNGFCNQVLISDVLCSACKQLLYRPTVLNCGHVFCEMCIAVKEDEVVICQVCQCPHPSDFPKVCFEFSHFLEEKFPQEYASRRETLKDEEVKLRRESQPTCSTNGSEKGSKSCPWPNGWWNEHGSSVHMGTGCDYCGMLPIVGNRYQCQDCVEKIGFDLCEDCYNTGSKLPGRFNQQHTPDHRFKLIKPPCPVRNIMLRLVAGQHGEGAFVPVLSTGSGSEDSDDGSLGMDSGDVEDNVVIQVSTDDDTAGTDNPNSPESIMPNASVRED